MRAIGRLALTALALCAAQPLCAQSSGPRDLAFGFSGVSYLIEPSDAVYTDPEEHLSGNFGFRLTKAFFGGRRFGWMVDGELYLGVANRVVLDVDLPNTIFGLQAFAGPVVALGRLQTYATIGVNRTSVGESKIVTVPGPVVVQYVTGGGISSAWAAIMTERSRNSTGGDVLGSVPRYYELAAAGMFGVSYDFGRSGAGFRLSFDYIPIFMSPTRSNYRVTFSLAG